MFDVRSPLLLAAAVLALGACHREKAVDRHAIAASAATPAPPGGWVAQAARTADGGVRVGNPDAPVKLIEFGSRTCPACGAFGREGLAPLLRDYVSTGKVSFEFHDFLIHAPDLANTLLAQCAPVSSYIPVLEQMYAEQPAVLAKMEKLPPGFEQSLQGKSPSAQAAMWADELGYTLFMAQRGLPRAKASACLADKAAIDRIAQQMQQATATYNIDHTPTFVINGANQGDATTWSALRSRLDAVLGG